MTESGKIDWACHANDAAASIHDVLEMSNAVRAAEGGLLQRPPQLETLILVTADHRQPTNLTARGCLRKFDAACAGAASLEGPQRDCHAGRGGWATYRASTLRRREQATARASASRVRTLREGTKHHPQI